VRPQVEDQDAAAWHDNARRFREGNGRRRGVVQGLRQHGQVHGRVGQWEVLDFAAFPGDVRRPPASCEIARPAQDLGRAIDRNHALGPAGDLDGQISLAAAEVGDGQRRKEHAHCSRPGGPAPPRHELTALGPVRVEVLLAQPQHFLQPCLVFACGRCPAHLAKLRIEQGAEGVVVGSAAVRRTGMGARACGGPA
jgi:hypothetical protein